MNLIFLALVLIAFLTAAVGQWSWGGGGDAPMDLLTRGIIESAAGSVDLAIGLIGVMTLFLGLMKVAEAGGLLLILARLIRPLLVRLFPDVPPDHPAMGAIVLNLSANTMGLGNAATPFGIRAMQELNRLNRHPGTATDSMALFLAINTSSVTLLPTGIIALRAAAGSVDPAGILPTTLFATLCSTTAAIVAALAYRRFFPLPPLGAPASQGAEDILDERHRPGDGPPTAAAWQRGVNESVGGTPPSRSEVRQEYRGADAPPAAAEAAGYAGLEAPPGYPLWVSGLAILGIVALIPVSLLWGRTIAPWLIPGLVVGFLLFGALRGVAVYETFVEGAKEGFQVAVRIIPYLVAILVAVGMLRASGALQSFVGFLGPLTAPLGMPAEALPMALLRPLSGSGAYGIVASIINDPAIGPDSYTGYLVSTLQGSTETTFYVLAVYFGAVQVRRTRHALPAALTADVVAVIAAVIAVNFLLSLG